MLEGHMPPGLLQQSFTMVNACTFLRKSVCRRAVGHRQAGVLVRGAFRTSCREPGFLGAPEAKGKPGFGAGALPRRRDR